MSLVRSFLARLRKRPPSLEPTATLPASIRDASASSVLPLLHSVLEEHGLQPEAHSEELRLSSGLRIKAEFLDAVDVPQSHVRTCTHITATHDTFFPNGLAEFVHAAGSTVEEALREGFSNWAKTDLIALEDAARAEPRDCTSMTMEFPSWDGKPRTRRIIFGPTLHLATGPAPSQDEEHPFCPCCLFTNSMEAFQPVLDSEETLGIRLFASRDAQGECAADCRINGEDFAPGVEKLNDYARTWRATPGLEYRKQYVVVRAV